MCLERGADLHMAQLMPLPLTVSCFSKVQIGFTFLVPVHPGSPGKRAVKRVCVRKYEVEVSLMHVCYYCRDAVGRGLVATVDEACRSAATRRRRDEVARRPADVEVAGPPSAPRSTADRRRHRPAPGRGRRLLVPGPVDDPVCRQHGRSRDPDLPGQHGRFVVVDVDVGGPG